MSEYVDHRPGLGNELRLALAFLTRLPVRLPAHVAEAPLASAARAFPIAGAAVALAGALAFGLAWTIGLPPTIAGLIAVAAMAAFTGALHEDGLADFVDSLGARDPAKRLAIMRDSRIGTYGVLALIFAIGIRAGALAYVADPLEALGLLLAAAAGSRACVVHAMHALPMARSDGLARAAGRPNQARMLDTLAIGTAFVLLLGPLGAVLALLAAMAATLAVERLARGHVGGQTGDVLGAVQQIGEMAILCAALAASSWW
ncbi:MAG: adenosylcobinamide-GDP ribazoletransferase [Tagaea sp.]|nr:adenosylcobinamide-GDP ribazoletransferase [Tagaea sp.]